MKPVLLASLIALTACSSTPDTPPTQPTTEAPAPQAATKPPPPKSEAEPEEPLSTAPVLVAPEEMDRIDPGTELGDVLKAFNDKLFFDGAAQLDTHMPAAKRGQGPLDFQLQVFAMRAHAHNMMNEPDEAFGMYRRVLAKWTNLKNEANKLRKADPEHGDIRVARAFDAFAEAVFFMGERKRAKAEGITMPANDVGDSPAEMKKYVERNLAHWARRREKAIEMAGDEYLRVNDIKPDTPVRWVVATHSRLGAMYAQMAEELRGVAVPSSWQDKGASEHKGADGKPMTWEQIRSDHDARVKKLLDPIVQKAKASYTACVDAATGAKIEGPFANSCKTWLKAQK